MDRSNPSPAPAPQPASRKTRDLHLDLQSSFTTRAQENFRRGGWRRLAGASGGAVVILIVIALLGPGEDEIKERFEYYGAPGEMRIMPEISIEQGADQVRQLPRSLREPPPPARLEIELEDPRTDGTEEVPQPREVDPNQVEVFTDTPTMDDKNADVEQAELLLPQQTSTDWYILPPLIRPYYPVQATERDRQLPYVYVWLNAFVAPDGTVTDVLVESNDGSPIFAQMAIEAVKQWRIGWRKNPGAGRWMRIPWRFKSPYFSPKAGR